MWLMLVNDINGLLMVNDINGFTIVGILMVING